MKSTIRTMAQVDLGPALRRAAGAVAIAAALTYVAGFTFGEIVHQLNDHLATIARRMAAIAEPAMRPAPVVVATPSKRATANVAVMLSLAGVPVDEIASRLGVTSATVRRHLRNAGQ